MSLGMQYGLAWIGYTAAVFSMLAVIDPLSAAVLTILFVGTLAVMHARHRWRKVVIKQGEVTDTSEFDAKQVRFMIAPGMSARQTHNLDQFLAAVQERRRSRGLPPMEISYPGSE